MATDK
jgi:hypothetical protein